jgi:hypothetical protein
MTLDREPSTVENMTFAEFIQAIASDAAHDVLYDIMPTLGKQIPDDLPIEVWNDLCESFKDDLDRLIQNRLKWFAQSIQAEQNEIKRMQREQAIRQALWEEQEETRRINPKPAPAPDLPEIKVIYSHKAEPVSVSGEKPTSLPVKVIPSRKNATQSDPVKTSNTTPEPIKAIETRQFTRKDRTYQQTDLFYAPNEYQFAQVDQNDNTEAKPKRLRRRSVASSVAI